MGRILCPVTAQTSRSLASPQQTPSTRPRRPWLAVLGIALSAGCIFTTAAQAQGTPTASDCPQRLRVSFSDTVGGPFVRGQGEEFASPPGQLVDWMRAALQKLGCLERAELLRLPVRRVKALIQAGQLDMVAGAAEGGPVAALLVLPPREGRKQEFDFSYGAVDYALYTRRGSRAEWDGQTLTFSPVGGRVGVTAGSRTEMLARERSWPLETAPSDDSAFQKLVGGRTPVLLMHAFLVDDRLQRDADLARQIVRLGPAVERRHLHLGATPALMQTDPGFVTKLWRELCRQSQAAKLEDACKLPPG